MPRRLEVMMRRDAAARVNRPAGSVPVSLGI